MSKTSTNRTRVSAIAAQPEAAAKQKRPEIELTPIQQHVADLTSDLIMNGGHPADVDRLLIAAIAHDQERQFPDFPQDPQKRRQEAEGVARERLADWRLRLSRAWREPSVAPERPLPPTVAEMAREGAREALEDHCYDFLRAAPMEQIYLLRDVLDYWESSRRGPDDESIECPLAEGFMYVLASRDTFVRVPRKHLSRVRTFVDMLEDKDGPAKAA